MRFRPLLLLTLAAVVAAIAAVWLSSEREAVSARSAGDALLPGLADRLNEIQSVHVADAETGESVTLERSEDGWIIVEKSGYAANIKDLRRQLIALAEAEVREAKTANPENYPALGVEDPDAEDASSKLIRLQLPDGEMELIVGDTNFRGSTMTYVRRPGERQSWGASGNLAMNAAPEDWLAREVISVPTAEVRRVELVHPDGERVEIIKQRPEDPNFEVRNVPQDRALVSPSAGNSIAGALDSLMLEDVVAEDEFDPGDQQPIMGTYETFDGLQVTTRAWKLDDQRYVALNVGYRAVTAPAEAAVAELDGETAEEEVGETEPEDMSTEKAEPATQAGEAATEPAGDEPEAPNPEQRAAGMQRSVAGWVFRIPSYKHSNMSKRLEDLLKPEETDDEEID